MKKLLCFYILTFAIFFNGCASATISKRNQVEIGMNKSEVLAPLGEPDKTEKEQDCEALKYNSEPWTSLPAYCVLLDGGKKVVRTTDYCTCRNGPPIDTHLIIHR